MVYKLSNQGLNTLKELEGLRLKQYHCDSGIPTIGYGHTATAKNYSEITEEKAEELLKSDLRLIEEKVSQAVTVPLSPNQADALILFTFNIGISAFTFSTLLEELNQGHYQKAGNEFLRWCKLSDGNESLGLKRRRYLERKLFLKDILNKEELATLVYRRMKALGCRFRALNIVYLEDADDNGNFLPNSLNEFNDRSLILRYYSNEKQEIIFNALCTTEAGTWYRLNPMNPKGCAQIKLDTQFKDAWQFGYHGREKNKHPALVQCAPIEVIRDFNKNYSRDDSVKETGNFGINQHGIYGYSQTQDDIGKASAGCMVRLDYFEHLEFMKILRSFHQENARFDTIVLDASKLI